MPYIFKGFHLFSFFSIFTFNLWKFRSSLIAPSMALPISVGSGCSVFAPRLHFWKEWSWLMISFDQLIHNIQSQIRILVKFLSKKLFSFHSFYCFSYSFTRSLGRQ